MATRCRHKRDFEALEKRRLQAARLFGKGKSQAEVVRALGVSRQAVSRWHQAWQRAGRKPKLTAAQLGQVKQELLRGPLAHGYATILWTLPRIARLITKLTGVKYHPGHVWRIMQALDWSLQRPEHRAKERDDEAITRWQKRRWPQRKRGRASGEPGSSTSTRAASRSGPP